MALLIRLYAYFLGLLARIKWLPPLIGRISVGYVFAESGWGKLHNLDKVTEFFIELKLPAPAFQAHLVSYTELIAGTLVIVGLASRLASIPLIVTMVVAIFTAKAADVSGISDVFGMSEYLYIVILLWIIVEGPGLVSLDHFVKRKLKS